MAVGIGGHTRNQLMTLMPAAASFVCPCTGMGLIDNDQLRTCTQKIVPPPVGLDEVGGNNCIGELLEDRPAQACVALQPCNGAGQYQFGFQVEFLQQLAPAIAQRFAVDRGC